MNKASKNIQILFTALCLASYLFFVVFGLIHIASMAKMHMPMENCPFAQGEHSICPMSPLDHVRAWQQLSITLITLNTILAFAVIFLIFFSLAGHSPPIIRFLLYLKKEHSREYSLYQHLFSEGILNPKAP